MSIKQEAALPAAKSVAAQAVSAVPSVALTILAALSICHLLNDLVQSLLPAIYPILKHHFHLNFAQVGLITFTFQATASILQPLVGTVTDRRPMPYSLVIGMGLTLIGLVMVAFAPSFGLLLAGASVVGFGSAVFHPESSRMARLASGGRHGFAQSLFQVGGNTGSSLGPLLAALIIVPHGTRSLAWFTIAAFAAMLILAYVANWYRQHPSLSAPKSKTAATHAAHPRAALYIALLLVLVFSKYFYLVSLTSYYTFFLIHKFNVTVPAAQLYLFAFLAAVALGTFLGGPIGDRIGRKYVILVSIFGVLPFTLVMPHMGLIATAALSVVIGFVLASAFSAIIVYAQELVPGRIGLISGLFFGFAFGMAGIGAAVLGIWADHVGIEAVYDACAYLPAIGVLAILLPSARRLKAAHELVASPAADVAD